MVLAIYDGFPIRQCTPRLSVATPINACALAGMGRCCAPCDGTTPATTTASSVEQVRMALSVDARPALLGVQARLRRLVGSAASRRRTPSGGRLETLVRTGRRFHRVRSLAGAPRSSPPSGAGENWEIHVIRYGRLAAPGVATPRDVPQAVATRRPGDRRDRR